MKVSPLSIAPLTSPISVEAASEFQARQRGRDQRGHDLSTKKSLAAAEPVGHHACPRAEHERARELRAGDQTDGEHRVGQPVREQHLSGVLQPGAEVRNDTAVKVETEALVPQHPPRGALLSAGTRPSGSCRRRGTGGSDTGVLGIEISLTRHVMRNQRGA